MIRKKLKGPPNFNLVGFSPDLRVRFRQHCERSKMTLVEVATPLFEKYLDENEFKRSPFKRK